MISEFFQDACEMVAKFLWGDREGPLVGLASAAIVFVLGLGLTAVTFAVLRSLSGFG